MATDTLRMDRRRFLKALGLGSAGLACTRALQAAAKAGGGTGGLKTDRLTEGTRTTSASAARRNSSVHDARPLQ